MGGKKHAISKQHKDKYYHIAKEQGYRSRACFKLIQLNKKYQFLNNCNAIIDLCAAPGGWLQVCAKFAPMNCIKVGVDLDKIRAIPGCKTFVEDITTAQCQQILKRELQGYKADMVLNDGAPNVGANWSKDAFNQSELTLAALKIACTNLKRGGHFVTKVFRSQDYNSLIWVFNKFFKKVEANKPSASRFSSAEIFVVCLDYIAPDIIDEKLFDIKYVFQDTEADIFGQQFQTEIVSIDKILEKRRRRSGYADTMPMSHFQQMTFTKFMQTENPFPVFLEYHQLTLDKDEIEKYSKIIPIPRDFDILIEDIQVLGRKEIQTILKYRGKLNISIRQTKRKEIQDQKDEEKTKLSKKGSIHIEEFDMDEDEGDLVDGEEEDEELDDDEVYDNEDGAEDEKEEGKMEVEEINDVDKKLDDQIKEVQHKELKEQRKKRERINKLIINKGGFTDFAGNLDDEEMFRISQANLLKGAYEYSDDEDDQQPQSKNRMKFQTKNEMEDAIESMYEHKRDQIQQKLEQKKQLDSDEEMNDTKFKCEQLNEQQQHYEDQQAKVIERLKNQKWYDKELFRDIASFKNPLNNKIFINPLNKKIQEESSDEEDQDNLVKKKGKKQSTSHLKNNSFGANQDLEDIGYSSISENESDIMVDEEQEEDDRVLLKKRKMKDRQLEDDYEVQKELDQVEFMDRDERLDGELSGSEEYKIAAPKTEMEKRRQQLKRQREKKLKKEGNPQVKEDGFEIVAQKKMEDYDIDTLGETLAIARKMMGNRSRERIIDSSYNQYATEDLNNMPTWFVDDENRHRYKHLPVSKEEVAAERERLLSINARQPKKVMEAKIRKQKRVQKKLQKAKKKAATILDQDGVSENVKMRQVSKLYKKEMRETKSEKKYIVGKKNSTGKVNQGSRHTKYVDARSKKDTKSLKRAESKDSRSRSTGGSKNRQVRRHKRKKQKN